MNLLIKSPIWSCPDVCPKVWYKLFTRLLDKSGTKCVPDFCCKDFLGANTKLFGSIDMLVQVLKIASSPGTNFVLDFWTRH